VNFIPDYLLNDDDESNHASTMFIDTSHDVESWFYANLVRPIEWNLEHPDDPPPAASRSFLDYIETFSQYNYKVWDIQYKIHATTYLQLTSNLDISKTTFIAGRADFLVTPKSSSKATYLSEMLCVIEIQSKTNEQQCELQMLVYLLILMNTKHLKKLVGFLVYNDGQCRAFKANRDIDNNCVYEINDRFHVSHIALMLNNILMDL
jgi:hypothetical protein